jgi:hypothetical protein
MLSEHAVAPRIRVPQSGVRAPINLDKQPRLRRQEIGDVTPAKRHLPAKRHTKLTRPKRAPDAPQKA